MAETLTMQQRQAIDNRGGKLLVSAAAGSGKTKVLVDRLLSYILDPVNPADLDEFLIITYTKAAASELRGKIAKRLTEAVAQNPENRHLHKQLQRLYLTKISTVHAFCTDLLREYAYCLDITSDFRVADENECFELMNRVMQSVLDNAYANSGSDADFCEFINTLGFGRDDRNAPDIILRVYNSARCHLKPEQWLSWCAQSGAVNNTQDAAQTIWGSYLLADLHSYLDLQIASLQAAVHSLDGMSGCEKVQDNLLATIDQLFALRSCKTWDAVNANCTIDYGRLVFPSGKIDPLLKDQIKAVRDGCKNGLKDKLRRFSMNSQLLLADIACSQSAINGLLGLTRQFAEGYDQAKRNRNVLDFGDLEHKTLDLLTGKSRSRITTIAEEVGARFREVMVDEYQDTNAVQDAIFSALTGKRQNCFMVGDVKQSIYQFRLADPGIFLEKYNTYLSAEDAAAGEGRKIHLSSNFRSASAVIRAVNDVFSTCMCQKVGGLDYGEAEQLNEGIPHEPIDEREVELIALEGYDNVYASEADFIAGRIAELIDGTHMVRSPEGLRPITPEDIVILLRSPGSVGGVYQDALLSRGIACVSGGSVDILQTEEIEVMRSFLQVINNPLQDIPLLAVLTSRVIGFTADDVAQFRSKCKHKSIYEALQLSDMPRAVDFIALLAALRKEAQLSTLSQLFMHILAKTHMDSIYASLPDGMERTENLQSFCNMASGYETSIGGGLSRFLEHLSIMEERGIEANIEPNTSGAVRIMSIHKSKGLEFPVVFLCGLSKSFNMESARASVLCDKDLGLGVSYLDKRNLLRYPTLGKLSIAEKIRADSVSEEMRILYVAMTRAQDRLIMTHTEKNIVDKLAKIQNAVAFTKPELMTLEANCFGHWIFQTAFSIQDEFWHIQYGDSTDETDVNIVSNGDEKVSEEILNKIGNALHYSYPHMQATLVPSKQTATQIKGRTKDMEIAEQTVQGVDYGFSWRKPAFIQNTGSGAAYGKVMHTVMQYIRFDACDSLDGVLGEINRLTQCGCLSKEEAETVSATQIAKFFQTEMGVTLRNHPNVVREFKFSILDDAGMYAEGVANEDVLLQGVVDCAMISDDGIVILDFKTDRISSHTIDAASEKYRNQILAYAHALERIFEKPVKAAYLYFFRIGALQKIAQ